MPLRKLENLFTDATVRKFSKGQIILYPGDALDHVYYVREGYIKLYNINEQGEERVFLIFPPKTAFPILPSSINGEDYKLKYFYQAMTDTQMFQLSRDSFNQILGENKEAESLVLNYVGGLASELVQRLGIIENKDAKSKISKVLRYLISVAGTEVSENHFQLNIRVTHQDIATLVGLTRETTSVQIKQLEKDKVITHNKRKLLVIDTTTLID